MEQTWSKSTDGFEWITIYLTAMKSKYFVIFLAFLPALEKWVNSTLQKFHGCKNDWKRPKIFEQIIKDSSHRTTKKMQFLVNERYPLQIYCHGIENL